MKRCPKCKRTLSLDRFSSNTCWCKDCMNAKRREYTKTHQEQLKTARQAYFQNPRNRARRLVTMRENALRRNYGLSTSDWNDLYEQQDGRCAACGTTTAHKLEERRMAVDHCHLTGKVRGLLCDACNHAIGQLRDSVENALSLAAYLARTSSVEGFVLAMADDESGDKKGLAEVLEIGSMIEKVKANGWRRPTSGIA